MWASARPGEVGKEMADWKREHEVVKMTDVVVLRREASFLNQGWLSAQMGSARRAS
jgi:hypothetical protein